MADKTERLTLRLSPADAAAVRAAADEDGCSVSECVRARVASRRPRPRRSASESERAELARLRGELGKLGSNLNQIARVANETGRVDWDTLAGLREQFESLASEISDALPDSP